MIRHGSRRSTAQDENEEQYRWLCTACHERGAWTDQERATDGAETHVEESGCWEYWVTVREQAATDRNTRATRRKDERGTHSSTPLSAPSVRTHRDSNEPPADAPDRFDIPEDIGYQLVGKGINRVLVGPCGRVLTDEHSHITVTGPGQATVGLHDKTVQWQPDLRELDAWDHRSRPVGGYGPDRQTFPPKERHNEAAH